MALSRNAKMGIIFSDADILTARHYGAFNGLGNIRQPSNEAERRQIERLTGLRTYDEIRETGTRTPYIDYMRQF